MKEEEAIAIAQEFLRRESVSVGNLCRTRFVPVDEFKRANIDAAEGKWMISFAYNGPPIEKNPDEVVCPEPGGPTTIWVGDQSKEVDFLAEL